jgi:hypothetical protein
MILSHSKRAIMPELNAKHVQMMVTQGLQTIKDVLYFMGAGDLPPKFI